MILGEFRFAVASSPLQRKDDVDEVQTLAVAAASLAWTACIYGAAFKIGHRVGRADESNARRTDRHREYIRPDFDAPVPTITNTRTFVMNVAPDVQRDINAAGRLAHVDGIPKSYLCDFAHCDNRSAWPHSNASYSECRRWCIRHSLINAKGWRIDLDKPHKRRRVMFELIENQSLPTLPRA